MTRLAGTLFALTLLTGFDAAARELWRSGETVLDFSGSVRELVTVSNGTDAERFAEAISASLPPTACFGPTAFVDCPFLTLPTNPLILLDPAALQANLVAQLASQPDLFACVRAEGFADCPAFDTVGDRDLWASLTRVRSQFELRLPEGLSAVVVYDHEFTAGILDTFERGIGTGFGGDPFLDLSDDIHALGLRGDEDRRRWRQLLYRAYLRLEREHFEVTLGRQRIPWGVGRLWNPIDRLNPIGPLAIEGDQSGGIDALDVRWLVSGFTYLELVWAPADDSRDSAYAARFQTVLRDVDVGLVVGIFEEAPTFGVDLAGNVGDSAVRFEIVYTNPRRDVWPIDSRRPHELDRYWQIVASVDHNFDLGTGLYVLLEHLYNGNALGLGRGRGGSLLAFFEATDAPPAELTGLESFVPGPYVRPASRDVFGASVVVSRARHQTGLQLGYDLLPVLRGNLLVLYDWNGESAAFFPSVSFTGFSSVEITVGAQLFSGSRDSEYGFAEPLGFALVEWFF